MDDVKAKFKVCALIMAFGENYLQECSKALHNLIVFLMS